MTFKVNYGFQKAERDRAKQAKKEAKRREKEEAALSKSPPSQDAEPDESMPGEENPS
jgi:hypothetical protein